MTDANPRPTSGAKAKNPTAGSDAMVDEFDQTISIKLKRDEAIVLLWYLSREIWNEDQRNLAATFIDPAEPHSLQALLQELVAPLTDTGSPSALGIELLARKHLLRRNT